MEKESGHPYYEFAVCFADTGIQQFCMAVIQDNVVYSSNLFAAETSTLVFVKDVGTQIVKFLLT